MHQILYIIIVTNHPNMGGQLDIETLSDGEKGAEGDKGQKG